MYVPKILQKYCEKKNYLKIKKSIALEKMTVAHQIRITVVLGSGG